jgi:hypothetical protein
MSAVLRIIALLFFVLAALVSTTDIAVLTHDAALIPAGLACWVGSTLVP